MRQFYKTFLFRVSCLLFAMAIALFLLSIAPQSWYRVFGEEVCVDFGRGLSKETTWVLWIPVHEKESVERFEALVRGHQNATNWMVGYRSVLGHPVLTTNDIIALKYCANAIADRVQGGLSGKESDTLRKALIDQDLGKCNEILGNLLDAHNQQ